MFGYKVEDIEVLSDDTDDPRRLPTRENIVNILYARSCHDLFEFSYVLMCLAASGY